MLTKDEIDELEEIAKWFEQDRKAENAVFIRRIIEKVREAK